MSKQAKEQMNNMDSIFSKLNHDTKQGEKDSKQLLQLVREYSIVMMAKGSSNKHSRGKQHLNLTPQQMKCVYRNTAKQLQQMKG